MRNGLRRGGGGLNIQEAGGDDWTQVRHTRVMGVQTATGRKDAGITHGGLLYAAMERNHRSRAVIRYVFNRSPTVRHVPSPDPLALQVMYFMLNMLIQKCDSFILVVIVSFFFVGGCSVMTH